MYKIVYFRVDEKGQNKMTPLHYAARYGKIDSAKATEATKSEKTWKAIEFLMRHSNDKNAKDKYGFTVLHHAVYRGNVLAVQRLIEGQEVKSDEVDEQGNTALHLAAQGDHKEVCSLLLQRREGTMIVNKEGLTALHLASSAGSLSCIQELLEVDQGREEMLSLEDRWGRTPLLLATSNGNTEVVSIG